MCCYVYNCKNQSEKLSLYLFPRVNLCCSKEYQSLQKEGCIVWVTIFNRNTQNIKIAVLRICHEHFITGNSTELGFDHTVMDSQY